MTGLCPAGLCSAPKQAGWSQKKLSFLRPKLPWILNTFLLLPSRILNSCTDLMKVSAAETHLGAQNCNLPPAAASILLYKTPIKPQNLFSFIPGYQTSCNNIYKPTEGDSGKWPGESSLTFCAEMKYRRISPKLQKHSGFHGFPC